MDLTIWRDLALVWLSLLCFIALIIPIVVLYFAVRGMNTLHNRAIPLLHKAQGQSHALRARTETTSQKIAAPLLRARHRAAKIEYMILTLWPSSGRSARTSSKGNNLVRD